MFGDLFGESDGVGLGDFGVFGVLWGVGAAVIGLGFVAIVVTIVLRSARMAKRGQNPFTLEEDLAYQAMQSRTLAPEKSLEQRLAELDDLHARGVISDEEHRVARAEALRA
ncbi:SHOCT domain-containing protein [Curtobacterium sp. A7_M15]|uniref:SHOCT domain-containing protein n=1 Tax=Curtobacterium sp. A7_M15 TaxID=3065241 RepID=UPI0027378399|nr:SHOCT domain-containing protein [Curtobacterium sp. A7_M15]MDP4332863.1 SHOCT domain-containing protein [Curtobacterium sp. A7_M15]